MKNLYKKIIDIDRAKVTVEQGRMNCDIYYFVVLWKYDKNEHSYHSPFVRAVFLDREEALAFAFKGVF